MSATGQGSRRGQSPLSRAKKGAAFLTKNVGRDWRERINVHTLNLGSGCNCVLGQLGPVGDAKNGLSYYEDEVEALGLGEPYPDEEDAPVYALGFNIHCDDESTTFADLTAAWRKVIGS
jgi:hypothetical protein